MVEGPAGDWWMVYHGYENGFWTLGRQTLLDPVAWTKDGWFRAKGGDLSQPLAKPAKGKPLPNGMPLSDDFSTNRFGVSWGFYKFDVQMEVSGYHHNVAYDFLSLRPALYVAGQGAAVFRDMRYEALEDSGKS